MIQLYEKDDSKNIFEKKLIVEENDLPLSIAYKEKQYVLILTKNGKLLLNKTN